MNISNRDYLNDRDLIFQQFFLNENNINPLKKNIENIQLFLNLDFIKDNVAEQEEFINSLIVFLAEHDLSDVVQYLFDSKDLPCKPNVHYSNYQALEVSCVCNSYKTAKILIQQLYHDFLNLPLDKKNTRIVPSSIFQNASFNGGEEIIDNILSYPQEFYIDNIQSAFKGACIGNHFSISDKLLNKSIIRKSDNLISPILDQFPYYDLMYSTIDFNSNMIQEDQKIKAISYLLNEASLNPNSYQSYTAPDDIEIFNPEYLIYIAYQYHLTDIIDFLLSHEKTKEILNPFVNTDLIKRLIEKPSFDNDIMMNYFIIDVCIKRDKELYDYLEDIVKNGKIDKNKEMSQQIIDLYDTVEFNQQLESKIENSHKKGSNTKKKKV